MSTAGAAFGGSNAVVVELFTSQGCSSCPAADKFLGTLTEDDDIIALSLHVDYWDYIGWKDTFAQPKFTQRQHAYANNIKARSVYTPQIIVGGDERIVGSNRNEVLAAIKQHEKAPDVAKLEISRKGDTLHIQAQALKNIPDDVIVQLVRFIPSVEVDIKRGENAGLKATYHNIVNSWEAVAKWNSSLPLNMSLEVTGDEPIVVLLQQKGPAEIVAAAQIK